MKFSLLLFIIFITSAAGFSQSTNKEVDLSVNGVQTGSTRQQTLKQLGKPLREKRDPQRNECTGGYSITLFYDGLEVELEAERSGKNSTVVRLDVTGTKWKLSSGIKIGATKDEIKKLLGEPAAKVDNDPDRWVYELVEKSGPGAVDFEFQNGKLVNVTVLATLC